MHKVMPYASCVAEREANILARSSMSCVCIFRTLERLHICVGSAHIV